MAKPTKISAFVLRLLAMVVTLTATVVMATSRQHTTVYGIPVDAKFQCTPAFRFFVIANAIGSVYSLLVLFLPSKSLLWRMVVALDVVITMLLTASIAAAVAIGFIGKKGDSHAGWLPICDRVPKFCNHVTGAMVLGFCGALLYMSLLLHAIQTVLNPLLL
ncbi:CASP-like protein 1C2 [Magnolia sinica]|uniref:CASP-like protein 1C2 n=1 Tax=Magnolia sinica TaxID=86752 RepID=UPI00265A51E9|nr:CASP-like protein 1C2 [Magnolia sinica]